MSKDRNTTKEAKKPAQSSLKEKRAVKHAKKQGPDLHPPIVPR
jgi:hypothetical protein